MRRDAEKGYNLGERVAPLKAVISTTEEKEDTEKDYNQGEARFS